MLFRWFVFLVVKMIGLSWLVFFVSVGLVVRVRVIRREECRSMVVWKL